MIIKCALCQLSVSSNKRKNLKKAEKMIRESAANNADIIILPEIFNAPYDIKLFSKYAEKYPGISSDMLSCLSRELHTYIIGGSICEKDENNLFNTSYSFDRNGNLIGKHRKLHLFDVNIKDKLIFKESSVISPGTTVTVFDTEYCRIGLAICYDIRFPELIRKMSLKNAKIIIAPAAFNMITGPAHWEITARARAIDNQIFFIAASSARNTKSSYVSYGHSIIIDPWGNIIAKADEKERILYGSIDLNLIDEVRQSLPLIKHLKPDLYR
ncbi:MAG: carbon-nitrogen hydrolase family protein [Actinomycetota bacterium]|nr:carbon-nitrogen hydrolase family protein [Actinomycetota bacterium]